MGSPFKEIFISKSKHQGNHFKSIIINSRLKWSLGDLHSLKKSQNTGTKDQVSGSLMDSPAW